MTEALARLEVDDLQQSLREIQALLSNPERNAELRARLDALHPADVAYILEALPLDERLAVWDLVKADRDGEILLEVSEAVRESLIASMDSAELVAAAETLQADELADIAADLPPAVMEDVVQSLPAEERERLRAALSYPEGSVGSLMDFDHVAVRDDVTLEAVTRFLRRLDELPDHTDQLFVLDRAQRLKGTLPLARLIVSDLHLNVTSVMVRDSMKFYAQDSAEDAASAFERYDLVSAPVVDAADTLLGAVAYLLYGNVALGGVMALAMVLTLVLAAVMGVAIPWLRSRFGRDPAVGSSVLITACTDSGGFFIFLGLATLFLV